MSETHQRQLFNTARENGRNSWNVFRPYLTSLFIYLSSRSLLLVALSFAIKFVPKNPAGGTWESTSSWYRHFLRWDAGWYLKIIREGYTYNGNDLDFHPVVFYPLYPLIAKGVAGLLGIPPDLALLVVSNIAVLAAVPLFYRLVRDEYDHEVALYAVALLSFFPTSLFFSAGYTESLAFLLVVTFFLLLKKDRYLLAACCAGLATATRSTGLILLLPLLWELWRRFFKEPRRLAISVLLCSFTAVSGLLSYMLYLWVTFGNPFVFTSGTRAWQKGQGTLSALTKVLTLQPFLTLPEVWREGLSSNALAAWLFLLFLLLTIFCGRRLPVSYRLYAWGVLLLPYLTLSSVVGFGSFARYVLLAFPVFIIGGTLLVKRLGLGLSLTGLSAAFLFMYMVLFAQWYWVG